MSDAESRKETTMSLPHTEDIKKGGPCKKCPYNLGKVLYMIDPCPNCRYSKYQFGRDLIAEWKNRGLIK